MKRETKRFFWICLAVLGAVLAILTIVPAIANAYLAHRLDRVYVGMPEADAVAIMKTPATIEVEPVAVQKETGTNEWNHVRLIRCFEYEVPCFHFRDPGFSGAHATSHAILIESGRVARVGYESPHDDMNFLF